MVHRIFTILGSLVILFCSNSIVESQEKSTQKPIKVEIQEKSGSFQLLRDGQPYPIHGVGGSSHLDLLAKCGGNSIRTWGVEGLDAILDQAQKQGITVTVGIWLGHERHGFNYNDATQVANQLLAAQKAIEKYKNHPAVLMWGIGNEMEGYAKGDNAAIWSAINNIAVMAKKIDPNHPTMTVIAEIGGDRVKNIHNLCPDIDVVGINSYGGVASIPKRYRDAGGKKPYVITEFGPPGVWESKKNSFGSYPEMTSTEKAEYYRKGYEGAVNQSKGLCLGSYAFVWGNKQEATATWFGMLLPDGSRTAAVDICQELWTGKKPLHPCPKMEALSLVGSDRVEPGAIVEAKLKTSSPETQLKVQWVLQAETQSLGTGGDAEATPPTFPEAILKANTDSVRVQMPKGGGGYRLFAYIRDSHGGAAVGNIPLFVNGPIIQPKATKVTLPFVVYDESTRKKNPFVPSGFMGNTKAIKLQEDCTEKPHSGKTCIQVDYQDQGNWGGVVWQNPANNWGDAAGGLNLTGAKVLSFWARGASGGEEITFEFGIINNDKKFHDSGRGKLEKQKLTTEWKRYEIDLRDKNLTRIITGFVFVVAGGNQPITFYLDDIQFE